jgi:hypothetical protein
MNPEFSSDFSLASKRVAKERDERQKKALKQRQDEAKVIA